MSQVSPPQETKSVPFDPGFSKYNLDFPTGVLSLIQGLSKIKNKNQLRYQLQLIEGNLNGMITSITAFCYGSLAYAGYLKYKYGGHTPATVYGNPFLNMSSEQKEQFRNAQIEENQYQEILEVIEKLNEACLFYIKRSSRINPQYVTYINLYLEFLTQNDFLIELKETSQIQYPSTITTFKDLPQEGLDAVYTKIMAVIHYEDIKEIFKVLPLI